MDYDAAEAAQLANAVTLFSVRGHLWAGFDDGRLCAADPNSVRCYKAADSAAIGAWFDVIAGPDGAVMARSASSVGTLYPASVGTLHPASERWEIVSLPDQGDRYTNFLPWVGLFHDPGGNLVTQTEHGIAVLRDGIWYTMPASQGAPAGTIVSAMTDATGQFWLQVEGLGLIRWANYGRWEAIDESNGLPDGNPWQTAVLPDATMWASTDTGVVQVVRNDAGLQVGKIAAGSSFAIGAGARGMLWSSFGRKGLRIINPADASSTFVETPPINAIQADPGGFVWLGTEKGLFRIEDRPPVPYSLLPEGPPGAQIVDLIPDGAGGILYLASGRLRHRHHDGDDVAVSGPWPHSHSQFALAVGKDGDVWTGGERGLFRLHLAGDRISSYEAIPTADTQSSTVLALMADHRGWIWAGTAHGVSVFDGSRWVSVDSNDGLLSDDVSQGGVREDPDGSVWVVTSHGLSHLLNPAWLFKDHPLAVLISDARLGADPISGRMPYTTQGLSVQFGTPTYEAERSIFFRYRLSDVDAGWVDTVTGTVRYPSVPPGRHLLTVIGVDRLTHHASAPCTLAVDVAYPWWRQWWSEALWTFLTGGSTYGIMLAVFRARYRAVLARQAELQRHVTEATAQLAYQAAHDKLTGLLNRGEVERRLAETLEAGRRTDGRRVGDELLVALLDVDHFKRINDQHGHLGGDDVLRTMGRLAAGVIGRGELAGRYGGEEILIVLQDGNGDGAGRVLNLHRAVQAERFKAAGATIDVTCSIGLTWALHSDDWPSIIGRADQALYKAKAQGRNRVMESPRTGPVSIQHQ